MKKNFQPFNSRDLCTVHHWGRLQERVYHTRICDVNHPIQQLIEEWCEFDHTIICAARLRAWSVHHFVWSCKYLKEYLVLFTFVVVKWIWISTRVVLYHVLVACKTLWHCCVMQDFVTLFCHASLCDAVLSCNTLWRCSVVQHFVTLFCHATLCDTVCRQDSLKMSAWKDCWHSWNSARLTCS